MLALAAAASAAAPTIQVRTFVHTGQPLGDVVWTGSRFLYFTETAGTVFSSDATGAGLAQFSAMPKEVEEFRCEVSPGTHGWRAGDVYCHTPGNKIYRIAPDGTASVFATIPETARSDGALTFDGGGRFGYAIVAATGRSGADVEGGKLYVVRPDGSVRAVGSYGGPGGAENVIVAPPRFGRLAGQALLSIDAEAKGGRVIAIDARGKVTRVARFKEGVNPIVPVGRGGSGTPAPGMYVTATLTTDVYLVPAAQLARYAGGIVVASEVKGHFWAVVPSGRRYRTIALPSTLAPGKVNFEGAKWVSAP